MAYTYAQLQDIKDRIVRDLAAQQQLLANAKAQFGVISSSLTTMQSQYAGWAGEVNAMATANPGNAAIQALKSEKDLLVSEFASAKSSAGTLDALVNP